MTSPDTPSAELLPCPFCGSPAALQVYDDGWIVGCSKKPTRDTAACPLFPACTYAEAKDEAIAAWNRRAPHDAGAGEAGTLRVALANLVRLVEPMLCHHETTHRGGAIWTICDDCGTKWADDRGGFQPYEEPPALTAAYAALRSAPAPVEGTDKPFKSLVRRNYPGHANDGGEVVVKFRTDAEMEAICAALRKLAEGVK